MSAKVIRVCPSAKNCPKRATKDWIGCVHDEPHLEDFDCLSDFTACPKCAEAALVVVKDEVCLGEE